MIWLALLLVILSLWTSNYLLYLSRVIQDFPHLLGMVAPLLYLMGPSLYFFVRQSSQSDHSYRIYDLVHCLPALYVLLDWIPVYGWSATDKLAAINAVYGDHIPAFWPMLKASLHVFLMLFYAGLAWATLRRRSDSARIRWLRMFCKVFALVLIGKLLLQLLFLVFAWNGALYELTSVLIFTATIHTMSYLVFGKVDIVPEDQKKYGTSPLTSAQIKQMEEKILHHLQANQPWRSTTFSLNDLASQLDIPRHHLSQALSQGMHKSFYDLVAELRIEEVKRRLIAGDLHKYSLLGVATECGFGSKSSFNRTFKKVTGSTPIRWLQANPMESHSVD